jgi:ribosome-binding factor A
MSDRRFPRTARVNEVVREVVADELEQLSDPRLDLVTVTGVVVSPDLKHATVYYSSLDLDDDVTPATEESRVETAKALGAARKHLQAAVGRQVRMKYVPRLAFLEDPAVQTGRRIDIVIRELQDEPPDED